MRPVVARNGAHERPGVPRSSTRSVVERGSRTNCGQDGAHRKFRLGTHVDACALFTGSSARSQSVPRYRSEQLADSHGASRTTRIETGVAERGPARSGDRPRGEADTELIYRLFGFAGAFALAA